MEITLEKIELVKDRTGLGYKDAKDALESAEGNVVDAIIILEGRNSTFKESSGAGKKQKSEKKVSEEEIENKKKELTYILNNIVEDPSIPREKKIRLIIHTTSLVCGIVAAQPIPFADIVILSPIQLIMVTYLNKVIGNPYEKSKLREMLTSLFGIVGWGLLAQQLILGAYKTVVPFLGAITTIPLVYAATFALGTGAKTMLEAKMNDQHINDDELKSIIAKAKEEAKKENKGLTPQAIMDELKERRETALEYENYKSELRNYEQKLKEYDALLKRIGIENLAQNSDTFEERLDISSFYKKRLESIRTRFTGKYKNIIISDLVFNALVFLNYDKTRQIEQEIGQLNFQLHEIKLSKIFPSSNAYEFNTNFGTVFLSLNLKKIYIQYIDFNEDYKSLLPLMDLLDAKHMVGQNKILYRKDIKDVFIAALKSTKEEIDIVSPWISENVMKDIEGLLEDALKRGVKINILYGIKKGGSYQDNTDDTPRVAALLKEKFKHFSNFSLKEGNTHVKLLICDNDFYVMGSYNFLSFGGQFDKFTRDEISMYSKNTDELFELRKNYFL